MDGQPVISADVLGSYATDAALEVAGVQALVDGARPRGRGVRVTETDGALAVELQLEVAWGCDVVTVGVEVQQRVAGYLARMSGRPVSGVAVSVAEVSAPPAATT